MSDIKAGRDISPFGVRIPTELKKHLEIAAKKNGRSLNAEIIYRLDKSINNELYEVVLNNKEFFLDLFNEVQNKKNDLDDL